MTKGRAKFSMRFWLPSGGWIDLTFDGDSNVALIDEVVDFLAVVRARVADAPVPTPEPNEGST